MCEVAFVTEVKLTVIEVVEPDVAETVGALAPESAVAETARVKVAVGVPVTPLAVIVKVVELSPTDGVPETVPLVVLKESPVGKEGDIEKEVAVPPKVVTVKLVIALPRATEMELVDRTISAAGVSAVARAATSVLDNARFHKEIRPIFDSKNLSADQLDFPIKLDVRLTEVGLLIER